MFFSKMTLNILNRVYIQGMCFVLFPFFVFLLFVFLFFHSFRVVNTNSFYQLNNHDRPCSYTSVGKSFRSGKSFV